MTTVTAHIAGTGCVTPFGCDLGEIWKRIEAGERPPLSEVVNPESGQKFHAALVPHTILGQLTREPRLRRASGISLFAAAAGIAALADSGTALTDDVKSRTAVVFGVSDGGVQYTRRFYEQIVKLGADKASPLLFPETVYNAPASHLAAMLGLDGASYTLVGDGTVGMQALEFGAQLIALGDADHVLVVAAEELDWILLEAHHTWRLLAGDGQAAPHAVPSTGALLAEGAAAVLLTRSGGRAAVEVAAGSSFCGQSEAPAAFDHVLQDFAGHALPAIILDGANGTWVDKTMREGLRARFTTRMPRILSPKLALGESPGCGALQQVVAAVEALKHPGLSSALAVTLGWNQQAAAARVTAALG